MKRLTLKNLGLQGVAGVIGATGAIGATGNIGLQGVQGLAGIAGTSTTVVRPSCSITCLPVTCSAPAITCELGVSSTYYGTTTFAPPSCTQTALICPAPVCQCL